MNQIQPHPLWVGHVGEGRDFRRIFDAGIRALVQLAAEEPPPQPPRELICCHFPLLDGPGNPTVLITLSVQTVATLIRSRISTLITSGSGVSRAPAVAAAALATAHGEPLEKCLQAVVRCHPSDVSPGLWSELAGVIHPED
jgi:hypothetical protein